MNCHRCSKPGTEKDFINGVCHACCQERLNQLEAYMDAIDSIVHPKGGISFILPNYHPNWTPIYETIVRMNKDLNKKGQP